MPAYDNCQPPKGLALAVNKQKGIFTQVKIPFWGIG